MLNFISKNNQYNWIIKQHPSNSYYKSKDDIDNIINEILINNKNVILFPDNIDPSTLGTGSKIWDGAVKSFLTLQRAWTKIDNWP